MKIFPWLKKKDKLILVFDIGSSSIGGVLFWVQPSGIPKIVKVVRESTPLQENLDIEKFLSSTMKTLEIVVNKIYSMRIGKPAEIFCVLSSPWHISQTRVIKLQKNTSFLFTPKLALDLIQKETALFEEEYLAKYLNARGSFRSIEYKNIKTMLNGYETSSPLDQKAKDLEMTILISISPEQVLKKIEEIIGRHFHFKNIRFSSFSLASFAVVRDVHAHNEDFLLIDIGGEVTNISMAKKNILRESISFPLGCNFIVRKLASALQSPLSEAKSLFSLFQDEHATEHVGNKIAPIVNQLKTEWLTKFQESLANLSNDISIPSTIYIVVDKDKANFFRQTIENEQFNQYTLTESKFKLVFLNAEFFYGMALFNSNIHDPNLIVDAVYINRFLINPALSGQI